MSDADKIELNITSDARCLPVVRSAAERMAQIAGFSDHEAHELSLAIDEALANVIKHGYQGAADQPIRITLTSVCSSAGDRGICIVVRDQGCQVDPSTIRSRDLDDVRPGGLGVHIIRTVMDEVEYSCPSGGGMQLRMTKFVSASGEAPGDAPPTTDGAAREPSDDG